jgi:hypothetical protein
MEQEVLKALLEMIKTGGQMAVWGIVAYWGMQLLTVAVKGGIICWAIKIITQAVILCLDSSHKYQDRRITVISKDCSDKIQNIMDKFQQTSSRVFNEIEEKLKTLSSKSGL